MQTVHVVFNPASGTFSTARSARILSLLRAAGLDPQPLLPQNPAEAHQLITHLCNQPSPPVIIAVGGDGTITANKPFRLDSDCFGSTPLTIRAIPHFNNLIV